MVDRDARDLAVVIRANLLPRARETVRLFGVALALDYLREGFLGMVLAALVAGIGLGIEQVRIHRLEVTAAALEASLAAQTPARNASKRLALELARYQEFAREAGTYRRSGSLAALAIARIGNTVPAAVWLESLDHDADGYTLSGASRSVRTLSGTMLSLGTALPGTSASLLSIDNHTAERDPVRFRARLTPPGTIPKRPNAP